MNGSSSITITGTDYGASCNSTRWWDGGKWGPYPSGQHPDESNKTAAMLAHGGFLVGGFIVPLIVYLSQKRASFARHHGAEALNFQLTLLIGFAVSVFVGIGSIIVQQPGGTEIPWGFLAIIPLFFVLTIANYVLSIIGMVKAAKLERWRYPMSIRFVTP